MIFSKYITLSLITFSTYSLFGQSIDPVKWTFELKKQSDNLYQIMATATIEKGWVLYAQSKNEDGPIPTIFELEGKVINFVEKTNPIKEFDKIFDMELIKYKKKAVFTSEVQRGTKNEISGMVTFMTCDGAKCLPPKDVTFSLKF